MGRALGILGICCLLLIGVSSRFPFLYREIHMALSQGQFEFTEQARKHFLADALSEINNLRSPLPLKPMQVDGELQTALTRYVARHPAPDKIPLEDVFEYLQEEFPGAQFLSANVSRSLSDKGLIESIARWDDVMSDDYEALSSVLYTSGPRLGCISVLSKRLPEFSVTSANKRGGRYFNRCPHCRKTHAVELNHKSRTLVLACPDCSQPYDVLAADTEGTFYRVNDFLLGFQLPHVVGAKLPDPKNPSKELLLHMWRTIVDHCVYENDTARAAQREAWKTPDQTWLERAGDCEDTSILLADSLISAGFEARVAVGWNSLIGQHAWCVAKVDGEQYVLESTIQDSKNVRLLTATKAAAEYRPEQLFDRSHLYFRVTNKNRPLKDYWADDMWKSVEFLKQTKITKAKTER